MFPLPNLFILWPLKTKQCLLTTHHQCLMCLCVVTSSTEALSSFDRCISIIFWSEIPLEFTRKDLRNVSKQNVMLYVAQGFISRFNICTLLPAQMIENNKISSLCWRYPDLYVTASPGDFGPMQALSLWTNQWLDEPKKQLYRDKTEIVVFGNQEEWLVSAQLQLLNRKHVRNIVQM